MVWVRYASRDGSATSSRSTSSGVSSSCDGVALAERALRLVVAGVADQDHLKAAVREAVHLAVHLGDERAGGVDDLQPAAFGFDADSAADSVCGEDHDRPVGNLVELVHEDRAFGFEVLDHVAVVDDLAADVDGRSVAPLTPASPFRPPVPLRRRTIGGMPAAPGGIAPRWPHSAIAGAAERSARSARMPPVTTVGVSSSRSGVSEMALTTATGAFQGWAASVALSRSTATAPFAARAARAASPLTTRSVEMIAPVVTSSPRARDLHGQQNRGGEDRYRRPGRVEDPVGDHEQARAVVPRGGLRQPRRWRPPRGWSHRSG